MRLQKHLLSNLPCGCLSQEERRCHLSSLLANTRGAWPAGIWDPTATAPPANPSRGAGGCGSVLLLATFPRPKPGAANASACCSKPALLRYLRERVRRMPTAEPGCARMRRPATAGFGSHVVSGPNFTRFPSPPIHPPPQPPLSLHPSPLSLLAYVKNHQPPTNQILIFQGIG